MREIVFDTETTGLDPEEGHKLVEIGCVEVEHYLPTGRVWHHYINPERDIPADAAAVHGITDDMVKDKPVFAELVTDFLDFIGNDAKLVAHNAKFDMKFINAEIKALGFPSLSMRRVVDTLDIARARFPGSPATLDALCKRFEIDNSSRTYHGALLDAQLLADVYLELSGGRQRGLSLASEQDQHAISSIDIKRSYREPRPHQASHEELEAWTDMLLKLKDPLWKAS